MIEKYKAKITRMLENIKIGKLIVLKILKNVKIKLVIITLGLIHLMKLKYIVL